MKKNCTFYIIRHGETEWNVNGIIQGQKDSSLTQAGIKQAEQIAKLLKSIKFDMVCSSDLLRAKRTAKIIALEKNMVVKTSKLLREKLLGRFEGKKYEAMRKELRKQVDKRASLAKKQRLNFRLEDGMETDEEVISRLITFLRETALAYSGKKVLVVTHGVVMRTFLIHLGWAEYEELPPGSVGNTAYLILESDGIDFFVKKVVGATKCQLAN